MAVATKTMTENSSLTSCNFKKYGQPKTFSSSFSSSSSSTSSSSVASFAFQWLGLVLVAIVVTAFATVLFVSAKSSSHIGGGGGKALFPLTSRDYIGFFLAVLGLMVAAGGGIGGGGILVPIYILVLGFSPKQAIPLSIITVFGGAMANTVVNIQKRHPLADRPLIDWKLILIMEPLAIAGALMGAFLNMVLPELLLTILLVILLAFTANTTLRKAFEMYAKESAQMRGKSNSSSASATSASLLGDQAVTKQSEVTKMVHNDEQQDDEEASDAPLDHQQGDDDDEEDAIMPSQRPILNDAKLQEELDQILYEERTTPVADLMILMMLLVVVLAINMLSGGGAMTSPIGIKCGSRSFWIANAIMITWIVVITMFVRQYLLRKFEQKQRCQYPYVEGDIQWNAHATIAYPMVCCLAGFFAGMFGVGGGIVFGPLMLVMGVHPPVASASLAVMILFTSFTATTSFLVFGLLVMDYAAICLIIGFVATLAGQLGLSYLMKHAQRNSYIAFAIGGVVLLSAVLMTIQSLLSMAAGEKHHAGGICGNGD